MAAVLDLDPVLLPASANGLALSGALFTDRGTRWMG